MGGLLGFRVDELQYSIRKVVGGKIEFTIQPSVPSPLGFGSAGSWHFPTTPASSLGMTTCHRTARCYCEMSVMDLESRLLRTEVLEALGCVRFEDNSGCALNPKPYIPLTCNS